MDTSHSDLAVDFEFRRLRSREELDAAMALRYEVFCTEQGRSRSARSATAATSARCT